jgi:RNA polymerase sigma-70 factor (ECF subfamily)
MADVETVGRIARRDETALAELFDKYAPSAMALAMRVAGDAARAESVVVETFHWVWRAADRYDESRGSVAAWLLARVRAGALRRRVRPPSESKDPLELAYFEGLKVSEIARRLMLPAATIRSRIGLSLAGRQAREERA